MTIQEAIHELKMMMNKCRGDFYSDRRNALEIAINALYEKEEDDEYGMYNWPTDQRSRYKDITERH